MGPNQDKAIGQEELDVDAFYQRRACMLVVDYVNTRRDRTDDAKPIVLTDVYIVWFCKTLQNWKALLSTTVPDLMYYELTHDGEKQRIYLDAYRKIENVTYPDPRKRKAEQNTPPPTWEI
jgi:Family of unknown function (DUF6275)